MRFILKGRGEGKTHELVQWVLGGLPTDSYPFWSRIILTSTIGQADQLRHDYPQLDYRQVFAVYEWQHARRGTKEVNIGVDNIDNILASLYGNVVMVTATGEKV